MDKGTADSIGSGLWKATKKGASADRYDRYKAARTLQQVLDLGGSRGDIANDMVRGYIQCEDPATQEAILMTANESERRRLPAHLQRKLPPSGQAPPKRPPWPYAADRAAAAAALSRCACGARPT